MSTSTANTALNTAATAGGAIASFIGAHTAAAGAGAAAAGAGGAGAAAGSAWVPFIGPAIAAVTLALGLWMNRKGPRQKVATTGMVNDLEPILRENRDAYLSSSRTKTDQRAALKNFDDAWAWLTSAAACGSPEMGNPGKACIADRSPGGKWDWFSYYRNPIAEDAAKEDIFGLPVASAEEGNKLLLAAALVAVGLIL